MYPERNHQETRVNRSIQAEGSFAMTKEDMQFRRFLTRLGIHLIIPNEKAA